MLERLGKVGQWRDTNATADEQGPFHVEAEAVAERPENRERITAFEPAQRSRTGTDRIDQERKLAARGKTKRHRPWEEPSRRFEHEKLPRNARVESAAVDMQHRVWPELLGSDDVPSFTPHGRSSLATKRTPRAARRRSRAPLQPRRRAS